jgi:protein-tyrosine-phosphatase
MSIIQDPFAPIAQPSAVLFACNLNIIRSPMAEALLKRRHGQRIFVDSCGIRCGSETDGFAISVMDEIGLNLQRHQPKSFDDLEDDYFDLIISLSPEAQHRAIEMTRTTACDIEYWPIFDATIVEGDRATRLAAYRQVRDDLDARIAARFPVIPIAAV